MNVNQALLIARGLKIPLYPHTTTGIGLIQTPTHDHQTFLLRLTVTSSAPGRFCRPQDTGSCKLKTSSTRPHFLAGIRLASQLILLVTLRIVQQASCNQYNLYLQIFRGFFRFLEAEKSIRDLWSRQRFVGFCDATA